MWGNLFLVHCLGVTVKSFYLNGLTAKLMCCYSPFQALVFSKNIYKEQYLFGGPFL